MPAKGNICKDKQVSFVVSINYAGRKSHSHFADIFDGNTSI